MVFGLRPQAGRYDDWMEVLPVDLTAIVGIIFGMSVFIIPIAGLTARFALKPVVEAFGLSRRDRKEELQLALLEKRVALLERQLEAVGHLRGTMESIAPITENQGMPLPVGTVRVREDR